MLKNVQTPADVERFFSENKIPRGDFSEYDIQAVWKDIERLEPGQIVVEVGVRFGKSLGSMILIAKNGVRFYGIDCDDLPGRVDFWQRSKIDGCAKFIHAPSAVVGEIWGPKIHFLHIDGDHTYEGVSLDIDTWTPHMAKGGVIFFHDCDSTSPGVVQAVKELKDRCPGCIVHHYQDDGLKTSIAKVLLP